MKELNNIQFSTLAKRLTKHSKIIAKQTRNAWPSFLGTETFKTTLSDKEFILESGKKALKELFKDNSAKGRILKNKKGTKAAET